MSEFDWPSALRWLDVTAATVPENLAVDEALLRSVDADASAACLRVWESPADAVIVGRSNAIATEVDVAACAAAGVPIYRRCSGGGTVVIGPGVLCYSLVLPLSEAMRHRGIPFVTQAIMHRLAEVLRTELGLTAAVEGISDLTVAGRKVSGNAQRWGRHSVLHHGTFVLPEFDRSKIAAWLRMPSWQPEYRQDRSHTEFVGVLPVEKPALHAALQRGWQTVSEKLSATEEATAAELWSTRYNLADWHHSR